MIVTDDKPMNKIGIHETMLIKFKNKYMRNFFSMLECQQINVDCKGKSTFSNHDIELDTSTGCQLRLKGGR